jgi:hypothetical protein
MYAVMVVVLLGHVSRHTIVRGELVEGTVILEFLLIADALDVPGVEREGTLGDKGREENDPRADTELNTAETH